MVAGKVDCVCLEVNISRRVSIVAFSFICQEYALLMMMMVVVEVCSSRCRLQPERSSRSERDVMEGEYD